MLVGRAPFWLATFLFVFGFIAVFDLADPAERPRWRRHLLVGLVVAALASALIPYVFQTVFLVRLP